MPTCFEIYETYRRGPAAVLRLFEEALGTRAIYGPPDPVWADSPATPAALCG